MRSTLYGISSTAWKRSICNAGIKVNTLNFMLMRFHVQCFSTRRARASRPPKSEPGASMEESDAFYVVRKGDVIGVYKSFSECQDQLSSSVSDPAVSVYKGYSLCKETEEYLSSRGIKNAIYTINSVDAREDLFGTLMPCPLQEPDAQKPLPQKRSKDAAVLDNNLATIGCTFVSPDPLKKHLKLVKPVEGQPQSSRRLSCVVEFDGASKGNPGKAGAGAIIRAENGTVVSRLREGLGIVTNNVAEYRAVILGMKYALKKGYTEIRVQGDSLLVCMQVTDKWQIKNQNLIGLCKQAKELKDKFLAFNICHVKREFNSDADAEANSAVLLPNGEVYEESGGMD